MSTIIKPYHLEMPGICEKMFDIPFYQNECEKILFNGVINEHKIQSKEGTDFISLAPKFKPHSDYEIMLQSTDSKLKSSITSLSDLAVHYIFSIGYDYIKYLSNERVIEEYGLDGGYPYLVFNYDEFTTDRHSGMSKKPFHLHLNSWKKETINNIKPIEYEKVSSYYLESVIDPIFDITQILTRDVINGKTLSEYLESVNVYCGTSDINYSAVYKITGGWNTLLTRNFVLILKDIHNKLEDRYIDILKMFTGKDSVPELYTRHLLLPEDIIKKSIDESIYSLEYKEALYKLVQKVQSISPERFNELCKNSNLRDTLIPLRWLAYSVGLFSNSFISSDKPIINQDLYINITPRLFTKIGGASIMNFPEQPLVKIDRGNGKLTQSTFDEHVEFQKGFVKELKKTRW